MKNVTVDFVQHSHDGTRWTLVLVERGPWPEADITPKLRLLQDRLYGCVDAAIDGEVARRFPESVGKHFEIRLECYGLPEERIRSFFSVFSDQALKTADYASAFAAQVYASSIDFSLSHNESSPQVGCNEA